MASQSSGVSVVSAVSQWRQRAARAGGCQEPRVSESDGSEPPPPDVISELTLA